MGSDTQIADEIDELPEMTAEEIEAAQAAEGMFADAATTPETAAKTAAPVKVSRPPAWAPKLPVQTFFDAPPMSDAHNDALVILAAMLEEGPTIELASEFVACLIPDEDDPEFLAEVTESVCKTLRERAAKSEAERNRPTPASVAPDEIADVWNHDWRAYTLPEIVTALPSNFSRQERAAVLLLTGRATTTEICIMCGCSEGTVSAARRKVSRMEALGQITVPLPPTVVSARLLGRARTLGRPDRKGKPSPNSGRGARGGPGQKNRKRDTSADGGEWGV